MPALVFDQPRQVSKFCSGSSSGCIFLPLASVFSPCAPPLQTRAIMSRRELAEHNAYQHKIIEQAQLMAIQRYQMHSDLLRHRWFLPVTALSLFAYHKTGFRLEEARRVHSCMRQTVFGAAAMKLKRFTIAWLAQPRVCTL